MPAAPSTTTALPPRHSRRGSVYVLVLGTAILVTVLGASALTASHLKDRVATANNNAVEADFLAQSAIEYALEAITANSGWAQTYTSGVETATIALGHGTISFALVDELNNKLKTITNYQPIRLYGYGRVGTSTRVYSVLLQGDTPLDVLNTTAHSAGGLNNHSGTLRSDDAPVSCNGTLTHDAGITGAALCGSQLGSGTVTGGVTCPSPTKTMPSSGIFTMYKNWATQILWSKFSGNNGRMQGSILSATVNPWGSTNPQGIYYINVGSYSTFGIDVRRIRGTLLIDCGTGSNVAINQGPICWDPEDPYYPILIINHSSLSAYTEDVIQPSTSSIAEASYGNLNPPGTPYNGVENTTATDTYPSVLHGLIHIVGPSPNLNLSIVTLDQSCSINGTLIADPDIWNKGPANFDWDPTMLDTPPIGYSVGPTMRIVPGTWRWEQSP